MKRRELLTSKKAPWNRHFLHPNCQTPVEFDTLDSSFVRASLDHLVGDGEQRHLACCVIPPSPIQGGPYH